MTIRIKRDFRFFIKKRFLIKDNTLIFEIEKLHIILLLCWRITNNFMYFDTKMVLKLF